jgi:hypothetical protein
MSPWDAADLCVAGPVGAGKGWAAVDPADVRYGATLAELGEQYTVLNDFLEACAPAGRIGFCDSGIRLLILGAWHDCVVDATTSELGGTLGDAEIALDSSFFREARVLLDAVIEDLDRRYDDHFGTRGGATRRRNE